MRVFIIDTNNMGPELQGGMIGVVGSAAPTTDEKRDCIEVVSRYAQDGWAIAADPYTPIGRLAALTAEAACVPFVRLEVARSRSAAVSTIVPVGAVRPDMAGELRAPLPVVPPPVDRGAGLSGSRVENGGW